MKYNLKIKDPFKIDKYFFEINFSFKNLLYNNLLFSVEFSLIA